MLGTGRCCRIRRPISSGRPDNKSQWWRHYKRHPRVCCSFIKGLSVSLSLHSLH